MKKLLALTLILMFLFSFSANAQIQIEEIDSAPHFRENYQYIDAKSGERINKDKVVEEVYHLEKYFQDDFVWTINLVPQQRCFTYDNEDVLGVTAIDNNNIYIFAYPTNILRLLGTREVIDHEIGHAVSFNYDLVVSYFEWRGLERVNGYINQPVEVFAEDFRVLFGSRGMINYQPAYDMPGIKEKKWIADKIGYTLPWPEMLEYYVVDNELGQKEIDRADQVYNQKLINGDMEGALAAHRWADQIREAIGIPIQ